MKQASWTDTHTERLREMAEAGLSKRFISSQLGFRYDTLGIKAREYGIHFQKMSMAQRRETVGHLMRQGISKEKRLAAAQADLKREIQDAKASMYVDTWPVYRRWPEGT